MSGGATGRGSEGRPEKRVEGNKNERERGGEREKEGGVGGRGSGSGEAADWWQMESEVGEHDCSVKHCRVQQYGAVQWSYYIRSILSASSSNGALTP